MPAYRGTKVSGVRTQLLRLGWSAGWRAEAGKTRFIALACATLVLALVTLATAATWATYQGRAERQAARSPVMLSGEGTRDASALWGAGFDTVAGQQFSVVYLSPLVENAPLPPGVDHWPAPGQAVLSEALAEQGAAEGIAERYGTVVGRIAPEGLAVPGERLAYIRPVPDLMPPTARLHPITGYGTEPADSSFGDPLFVGPQWEFQLLLTLLLGLPALVLLAVAARAGAHARDRRTALVGVLGGRTRDRLLIALAEAVAPVALGATLAAAAAGWAGGRDVWLPLAEYQLAAADLRHCALLMALAWLGAVGLTLAVASAAALRRSNRRGERRVRPHAPTSALRRWALACPLMLLVAVRGPEFFPPLSAAAVLTHYIGALATLATLPAVIAVLTAAAGRGLARLGRGLGSPAMIVAGRRSAVHPRPVARVVAGVVVAIGLLIQGHMWYAAYSELAVQARSMQQRFGDTVLNIGPYNTPTPDQLTALYHQFPANAAPLTLTVPFGADVGEVEVVLTGGCPALTALRLPCTGEPTAVPADAEDQRVRALVNFYADGSGAAQAVEGDPVTSPLPDDGIRRKAVRLLVSTDGTDLPTAAIQNLAFRTLPQGAAVSSLGGGWLVGATLQQAQSNWIVLFGLIGTFILAAAIGLSGLAEFIRSGRALAPLSVLTGRRRVHLHTAAWSVLLPMVLAGLAGEVVGGWLAASSPTGDRPPADVVFTACTVGTGVLALVLWLWGSAVTIRQAGSWHPTGD
ncbi:ABC transporter permease [Kitasatospora sp. NPDC002227]|uniref:ABC transporter permease n=1 Tax=Kitasatospora sp. NPDC002227 TaxID=3154773 RepID=UPI00332029DF